MNNLTTEQAYANGRKDEREAVLKYLREEKSHCQAVSKRSGGDPLYDHYAIAYGVIIRDIEEWQ